MVHGSRIGLGALVVSLLLALPAWAQTVPTDVPIMVHPRSINVKAKGKGTITVVVACSDTLDPATIDQTTLRLGATAVAPRECALEAPEAEDDDDVITPVPATCLDLVCEFSRRALGVTCSDTSLTLTGAFVGGVPLTGTDTIRPVPCKAAKGPHK